jgi:aryl-alcohol dehydrogenase-like predicted oxidoreductase
VSSPHIPARKLSRRTAIATGVAATAAWALGAAAGAAASRSLPLIRKPIPSTKEMLPAVGVGTNNFTAASAEELAARREVLQKLPELGGSVVDTAAIYGESEDVIGKDIAELHLRDRLFLSTKVMVRGGDVEQGKAMIETSFRKLQTPKIDLLHVHNLASTDAMIPVLQQLKHEGRIRYVGMTTSFTGQHAEMLAAMKTHPVDFIQIDYSIGNRAAADDILPLALDKGIAVMLNIPFGGRRGANLLAKASAHPLPDWAAEIDATSWAQVMLKYALSHPAVTCAIPGTTKVSHLEDNLAGGRGRLPDAALRRRMEQAWDALA